MSSDDDTDFTDESDTKFHSELDPDVDMHIEEDVDATEGVDLHGDVDMQRDGDDEVEEDGQEEDEEDEDEEEDDGKDPRTIGQGEIGKYIGCWWRCHGRRSANRATDARPGDARAYPTAITSGACHIATNPRASPNTMKSVDWSPQWAGAFGVSDAATTAPGDANFARSWGNREHLGCRCQSAGGDCLSEVPLPAVPLRHVAIPDVAPPDVALPNVPQPEARPDGSVGKEWTSTRVAVAGMVVAFGSWSSSCLVRLLCSTLFITGIDYYMHHEVFGSLNFHFFYGFCTGFIFIGFSLFIVLWDIGHAAYLQLLPCKEPPGDGVESQ